jgi:hypothetical protein
MNFIYLSLIALICLETSTMEPAGNEAIITRTKTWQDLKQLTEPLLPDSEHCKLTESEYSFVHSELPKRIAENNSPNIQVLHATNPKSTVPNLTLKTPTGNIHISASNTSVLDLPEAQENPLQFIKENPRTAVVKGKVTLEHTSYFTTHSLIIYTDFQISSIQLDPKEILLTIAGSNNRKYKMLIYRLTKNFELEKLTNLEAQNKLLLEMLKKSFLCSRRSTK